MHNSFLLQALLQLVVAAVALAACNQDNCYRAFVQRTSSVSAFCSTYTTTINTATTALPTYATACSNSAQRISSACSCLVPAPTTALPKCTPTTIIDLNTRNGGFNQPAIAVGQKTTKQPPWIVDDARTVQASIDYENDGTSGTFYGGGFA